MPGETRQEEHQRLQKRTDELKHDHEDLSLDRTPFNQADHDEHTTCAQAFGGPQQHRERLNQRPEIGL